MRSFHLPLLGFVAAMALLGAMPSHAAKPGAFSVVETKSAIGNKPAKPPRTKNRCFTADQVDKDGFLYPDKLLAQHQPRARRTRTPTCARSARYATLPTRAGRSAVSVRCPRYTRRVPVTPTCPPSSSSGCRPK